jgi:hypothetical protein
MLRLLLLLLLLVSPAEAVLPASGSSWTGGERFQGAPCALPAGAQNTARRPSPLISIPASTPKAQ